MINSYRSQIDSTLDKLIPKQSSFASSLFSGARHALLSPGKRIRPLLTLCTAEMLDKTCVDNALLPACAIEMAHTYSLVHDDLPCMDDDDFRRGRPTVHQLYTEGHAVLIGDYLLTRAFEIIASAPQLSDHQKVSLINLLAIAGGGNGMIGGQIMDIEQAKNVDAIHARKTGALFRASVEFGGIIAHASATTLDHLRHFGMLFGNLFQIVDDLLDNDHPLGKEKASERVIALYNQTIESLHQLPSKTTHLQEVVELVASQVDVIPGSPKISTV